MTYRRHPAGFAAAWTAIRALGEDWAAARLGVSASRLRQLANPCRTDSAVLELAARADALAREQGLGAPILETYRHRLRDAAAAPGAAILESGGSAAALSGRPAREAG